GSAIAAARARPTKKMLVAQGESPAAARACVDWQKSWQPSPKSVAQENLQEQQPEAGRDHPGKELVMMRELPHLRLGLLQLINLGIDGLEPLGVVGAVVLPVGHIGALLQHAFVKVLRI